MGNTHYEYNTDYYGNVNILPSGIVLDDLRLQFWPIGGLVNVNITEDTVILSSSINQSIDFSIKKGGRIQYLFDNDTYSVKNVMVSQKPVEYELISFDKVDSDHEIYAPKWIEKRVFFIRYAEDEIIPFTNKTIIISFIILLLLIIILKRLIKE